MQRCGESEGWGVSATGNVIQLFLCVVLCKACAFPWVQVARSSTTEVPLYKWGSLIAVEGLRRYLDNKNIDTQCKLILYAMIVALYLTFLWFALVGWLVKEL